MTALKVKLAPVLAMSRVCGSGFAPPATMVKLMGFTWLKTFDPTVTHTGMVPASPAVCTNTWPQKVPAMSP